ncbi:MAG: oxygen-independent coproporphyrinogen III oxidase [Planctomycetes bacterium]|nr:oxygen-independent coproporphyrinogen III oxidase [Planctomycetota bacterium]
MKSYLADIDLDVFRRYSGLSLPRHVSYPMPTAWSDIEPNEAAAMLRESRERTPPNDLSLYFHIPFCEQLCRFCACTKVIQKHSSPHASQRTEAYVDALEREIHQVADTLGGDECVRHIHFGGGTPTYLAADQLERFFVVIRERFTLAEDAEIAIEIDPRVVDAESLRGLREMGFNRVSLGVQDFDLTVQQHVRRVQPFELVRDTVSICRDLGFASINFDLIYGLPYQTPETVRDTIEKTIALSPDRIAYYHYAQIPDKIATQRGLDNTKLPDSESKLEMFLLGVDMFEAAGFTFVGLDHFAKADEPLAVAQRNGTLQRNFQGMTTGGGLDLIGMGASSISHLGEIGFLQNARENEFYAALVNRGISPVQRGKRLTEDDFIRQTLLSRLYCYGDIRPALLEERFEISFADYFARELDIMKDMQIDGLVTLDDDGGVTATRPLGRVLIRNIAGVFDAYLDPEAYRVGDKRCFSASA